MAFRMGVRYEDDGSTEMMEDIFPIRPLAVFMAHALVPYIVERAKARGAATIFVEPRSGPESFYRIEIDGKGIEIIVQEEDGDGRAGSGTKGAQAGATAGRAGQTSSLDAVRACEAVHQPGEARGDDLRRAPDA